MSQAVDIIEKYFPELTSQQKEQFRQIGPLFKEWNSKINVVSRRDIDNIYIHHILHSLAIAKYINFKPNTKILDVGTGGGLPGIPLAILFPQSKFVLIDSIAKKVKVTSAIAEELGLENVEAYQKRAEKEKGAYDFIVSRAVTKMNKFIYWVKNNISTDSQNDLKNGILFLKGGDLTEEIAEIKYKAQIVSIADYFEESFFDTKKIVYVHK